MLSTLLTVFSEAFYWYPGGTDLPPRVLFYLVPTTALVWSTTRWPGSRWPAVVLAGAVYGFVTEGVLTPVVYGGFPFDPIAISYTSLAWHAVVTVGFGLVALHRVLVRGPVVRACAAAAAFGAFWGLWAMVWRLPPEADMEPSSLSALRGQVGPGVFALYTLAATVVVGSCHLLLGRLVRPVDLILGRVWPVVMLVAGLIWFAFGAVPVAPWAPLELAVLLFLCGWGLSRRSRSVAPGPPMASVVCEPVPPRRLAALAALPIASVATYSLLLMLSPSDDTIRVFLGGSVIVVQTVLGWALFIAALVSVRRRRPEPA